MSTSRLARIAREVFGRQCTYNSLPGSHCETGNNAYNGEPAVWMHQNAPSQPGSAFATTPRFRLKHAPPSPMQTGPTGASSLTLLQHAQPARQGATNINRAIPPTARESKRSLKRGTNRPCVYHVSLSSFLNMRIQLWDLIQMMPNLRNVLGGLGLSNRDQKALKSSHTIARFGFRLQESQQTTARGLYVSTTVAINRPRYGV